MSSVVMALALSLLGGSAAAAEEADLSNVRAAWAKRRSAAGTAHYVVRLDRTPPAFRVAEVWLDFAARRLRVDLDETYELTKQPGHLHRHLRSCRFDGTVLRVTTELSSAAVIRPAARAIDQTSDLSRVEPTFALYLLWGHGRPWSLSRPPRGLPLDCDDIPGMTAAGREVIDGRPCVRLHCLATSDELCVDPERDFAVTRASRGNGSEVRFDNRLTTAGWMPIGWTVTSPGRAGVAPGVHRYTVETADYDRPMPDGHFVMPLPRGGMLFDDSRPFRVRDDGSLEPLGGGGPASVAARWAGSRWGGQVIDWAQYIGSMLLCAATIVVLVGWRIRRHRGR